MSTLSQELDRYLTIRRGLGYDLRTSERFLRRFITFVEQECAVYITTELFLRWRNSFGHAGNGTWVARLGAVRLFAQWLHAMDSKHEVPPRSLIPGKHRRPQPYIYSLDQIRRLIEGAAALPSPNGIRGLTYSTLFGLIAVTGMRVGEAIALDVTDVDLEAGVITVRRGKSAKERLLPLAPSVREGLSVYGRQRDRLLGQAPSCFFVSDAGTRPDDCAVRYNFAVVCQRMQLRPAQQFHRHGRGPRIHDLRHTFAVHTLMDWYRQGKDAAREMLQLTTYLGHTKPAHTYWYIQAIPELLELAAQRSASRLEAEVRP
jgi:integrase/recombinase XerD